MASSLDIPRFADAATAAMGVLSRRAEPSNRTSTLALCVGDAALRDGLQALTGSAIRRRRLG